MSKKPWMNAAGQPIVNEAGQIIECATCPCPLPDCPLTLDLTITGADAAYNSVCRHPFRWDAGTVDGTFSLSLIGTSTLGEEICEYSLLDPAADEQQFAFASCVAGTGVFSTIAIYFIQYNRVTEKVVSIAVAERFGATSFPHIGKTAFRRDLVTLDGTMDLDVGYTDDDAGADVTLTSHYSFGGTGTVSLP